MSENLHKLNEQLDELLIAQLQLIQDYISVTTECESHQRTGFINLAKARYIQGFHSVSKNCLFSEDAEEEREAIVTVTREESTIDLDGKCFTTGPAAITYQEPVLNVDSDPKLKTQLNKQFGFLSSSTLKYAKSDFHKCLEKSIERVKIMEQLTAVREQYKKLMKEKLDLENCAPNSAH